MKIELQLPIWQFGAHGRGEIRRKHNFVIGVQPLAWAGKSPPDTTAQGLMQQNFDTLAKHVQQIDAAMTNKLAHDEGMSQQLAILVSIPGIATTTALAMLVEMPELGTLAGKQAASLAGLAPISRQSGKWQGKEHIRGGRPLLRRAIYMPALVAVRFNPVFKAKYDQLIQAGKPAKVALTAIMRKLIVMANALLRDRRKWAEISP